MKYIAYEVYECPIKPTECGKYIGKTPIYEQAFNACRNAEKHGKNYHITFFHYVSSSDCLC